MSSMTQNLPDACRQYNRPLTTDHQRGNRAVLAVPADPAVGE